MFCVSDEAALRAALPGRPAVAVALGSFDGVHLGHQALLAECRAQAERVHGLPLVCSFSPHPARIVRPNAAPPLLEPLAGRLARFAQHGMAGAFVKAFTQALARATPQAFVDELLVAGMNAKGVIVGEDFRFGHKRAGDVALLERLGAERGFAVVAVPPVQHAGQVVSSSLIRKAVRDGALAQAAALLGRPFALIGEVVHGEARGRTLGYPTANVAAEGEVLPPLGIYAAWVATFRGLYQAALSVGVHPTFDAAHSPKVEAFLLDWPGDDLYGTTLEVVPVARLRGEERFAGSTELVEQMHRDVAAVRERLQAEPPPKVSGLATGTGSVWWHA